MPIRPVKRVVEAAPTLEGAGVKLRRAFGRGVTEEFDPWSKEVPEVTDDDGTRVRITCGDFRLHDGTFLK
jgi:hypothetical protein